MKTALTALVREDNTNNSAGEDRTDSSARHGYRRGFVSGFPLGPARAPDVITVPTGAIVAPARFWQRALT
ncbi:hypothetical protein AB0C34_30065 [Nocardia sp. NPDC049220]|uniref:hypothetical protein n=1 Tax=Nocardia sp. NPDC049220 TaxID=3155273 RepID=UPI0033E5B5AD